MAFYAHSGSTPGKSDWQPLDGHLLAVARLASDMAQPFGLARAAYFAGLFHDLGKYTAEFQRRLEGADISVDHSTAGAVAMLGDLAKGPDKNIAEIIAYCIAGHHAGLPDRLNATAACLNRRVETTPPVLDIQWKQDLVAEVTDIVPAFAKGNTAFGYSMMGRMIFSCLVDSEAWIETPSALLIMVGTVSPPAQRRGSKQPACHEYKLVSHLTPWMC